MPRAYSGDIRERLIAEVESGASRRAAAEEFAVSASTAIIWVKCFRETGRCAAKSRGGSISPLEEHADFLLSLIEKEPDVTLDEMVLTMRRHRILGSRTAVWRFFKRHKITFKKLMARPVRKWFRQVTDQSASTYPVSGSIPRPRWRSARPGPNKSLGVDAPFF